MSTMYQKGIYIEQVLASFLANLIQKYMTKVKVKGHCQGHMNWSWSCHLPQGKCHLTLHKVIWPWPWDNTHKSGKWIQAWSAIQCTSSPTYYKVTWPRSRSVHPNQHNLTFLLGQGHNTKVKVTGLGSFDSYHTS